MPNNLFSLRNLLASGSTSAGSNVVAKNSEVIIVMIGIRSFSCLLFKKFETVNSELGTYAFRTNQTINVNYDRFASSL